MSILVCTNVRFSNTSPYCDGGKLASALEEQICQRGLSIPVERSVCLGVCAKGPNVRLAPAGQFFHQVTFDDVPKIVDAAVEHLKGL